MFFNLFSGKTPFNYDISLNNKDSIFTQMNFAKKPLKTIIDSYVW